MGYFLGLVIAIATYVIIFREEFNKEQLEKVGLAISIVVVVALLLAGIMSI